MTAAPPGTPIARFMEENREKLEEAMIETQMMINNAVKTADADHISLTGKFDQLRAQFGAEAPSFEETEADIEALRTKNKEGKEEEIPKPLWPVYLLNVAEAQLYLQDLLDYIVKNILKVKTTDFRRWPKISEDGLIPATTFDLWDEEVESVLPRQSYYGRNRSCQLNGLGERLTLGLAKLLMNLNQLKVGEKA